MKNRSYGRPAFYAGIALLIMAGGSIGCNSAGEDQTASGGSNPPGTASKPIPKDLPPETQSRIKDAQAQDAARQKAAMEQGAAMLAAQEKAKK